MLRTLDLCCGVGGWACAARGLPLAFVSVADHAADCLETWALNHSATHPKCQLLRADLATDAGVAEVLDACAGGIDLVLGAIPCEEVSTARGNRPLKDGQLEDLHALIDGCFALVKALRPRYWCFEDVSAILPHLPRPLDLGLPYDVHQINAADFGPQARRRVFFGNYPWPVAPPEPGPRTLGEVLRPGPYRTLSDLAKYERSRSKWYAGKARVQDPEAPCATVLSAFNARSNERGALVPFTQAQLDDPGLPAPTVSQNTRNDNASVIQPRFGAETIPGICDTPPTVRTGRGREQPVAQPPSLQDRPCPAHLPGNAVVAGHGGRMYPVAEEDGLVRVLEWQEAALLQGFPEDFVFAASWSRTWKMLAQAIPIHVGLAILKAIVADRQGDLHP